MAEDQHEEKMVWYRTPHSPSIAIHLMGQLFKAENGVLKIPEAAAVELDRMAKTRGDVASNFFKLDDLASAEAVAKAHRDANGRPDAIAGGISSTGTIKDASQPQLDAPPQQVVPTDLAPVVPPTTPNTLTQENLNKTAEPGTVQPPVIQPATAVVTPAGMSALDKLRANNATKPGAAPVK